jgi:uncharacterized protein (DUF1330 family)
MKTNHKLALAVLAGVSIGAAGAEVIHAQQVKTPPAYVIAEVDVADPTTMQKYAEKVPETLAPFSYHYLVRGGKTRALEGEAPKRIVVIAFDSAENARGWYDSPAYEAIKPIRQSAAKRRLWKAQTLRPLDPAHPATGPVNSHLTAHLPAGIVMPWRMSGIAGTT